MTVLCLCLRASLASVGLSVRNDEKEQLRETIVI